MLEFSVVIVLLIAAFLAVAWYARRSHQQRIEILKDISNREVELGDSSKFSALFEQEVSQQQINTEHADIDADPKITLSEQFQLSEVADVSDKLTPKKVKPKQKPPAKKENKVKVSTDSTPVVTEKTINEMMIAFTVMARDDDLFTGRAVKKTLESLDLHFGDMQIYHRTLAGEQTQILFSVANILDPGTLNPNSFATMTTPGLLMFARLPGPINGLTLFDSLLEAAQKMADKLDGVLSDESRKPLNQKEVEKMRSRILSLNLQLHSERNNYNND